MVTISVIKADIGGYVGHSASHPDILDLGREEMERAKQSGLLVDHHVSYCGDDMFLIMTHERRENNDEVHKLARDTLQKGTQEARKLKLYGAGQDLIADAPSGNTSMALRSKGQSAAFAETVTVMFTDIEGSTTIANSLDDVEWFDILQEHNRAVREVAEAYGAIDTNFEGDGFRFVFPGVRQAVYSALDVQQALGGCLHQRRIDLPVRTGLHTGDVIHDGDEHIGRVLHRAKRIADKAHPGQVLVSMQTKALAEPLRGVEFLHSGRFLLKGFRGRHSLFEVVSKAAKQTVQADGLHAPTPHRHK